jgi:transcriptional regulator with XRE-family HTH domain
MARVPATSVRSVSKEVARTALRARVGHFVRRRREQLGLRLIEITKALGYKSINSVSNVEAGREGIPAKRAYAWAEVLEVPRDTFFRFVVGEIPSLDAVVVSSAPVWLGRISAVEQELIAMYRRLPRGLRVRLRQLARELEARAAAR